MTTQSIYNDYIYILVKAQYYSISLDTFFNIKGITSNIQAITGDERIRDTDILRARSDKSIRTYRDFCFGEDMDEYYNLFDKEKILKPNINEASIHDYILTLIGDLTDANHEDMEYIMKWICWKYLHPISPMQSALIFKGHQGIGKGTFNKLLQTIFSRDYVRLNVAPELFGKGFSTTDERTLICELSEAGENNHKIDAKNAIKLKTLIMQDNVNIEYKHENSRTIRNHCSFTINSNQERPVLFELKTKGNRRYSVFHGTKKYDDTIGSKIDATVQSKDIVAQFLGYLLNTYGEELRGMAVLSAHKNKTKDILEQSAGDEFQLFWEMLSEKYIGEVLPDSTIRELFLKFATENGYKFQLISKLMATCPWTERRPDDESGKQMRRSRLIEPLHKIKHRVDSDNVAESQESKVITMDSFHTNNDIF